MAIFTRRGSVTQKEGHSANVSPRPWLGFPGQGSLDRHYPKVSNTVNGKSRGLIVNVDMETLDVRVTINCVVSGTFNNTSDYDFVIYASTKSFQLVRPENGSENVVVPSGCIRIGRDRLSNYKGSGGKKYMKRIVNGIRNYSTGVHTTNIYIGKLTDFGWDNDNQDGTIWIAGIGIGYTVDDPVRTYARPIKISGLKQLLDYFPGAIRAGSGNNGSWTGNSCNRSGGYFRKLSGITYVNRKNRKNDASVSTVFIRNNNGFTTIAPLIGND